MKILKRLLVSLLVIVLIVSATAVGGDFYVKSNYGIDIIKILKIRSIENKVFAENNPSFFITKISKHSIKENTTCDTLIIFCFLNISEKNADIIFIKKEPNAEKIK